MKIRKIINSVMLLLLLASVAVCIYAFSYKANSEWNIDNSQPKALDVDALEIDSSNVFAKMQN